MSTAQDLFPSLQLTVRSTALKFANFAELTAFWEHERNSFRPLFESSKARHVNPSAQYMNQLVARQNGVDAQLNEARNVMARYPAELKDAQIAEVATRLKSIATNALDALRTVYAEDQHGVWLSSEPQGQFILALEKGNRDEAAFAFLYLKGVDYTDEHFPAKSGTFKAQLFQANVTSLRGDAEAAAIAKITATWQAAAGKMVEEMEKNRREAEDLNVSHAKSRAAQDGEAAQRVADFEQFVADRMQENMKLMAASQEELKKLADTYDAHMKLQAPVAYWGQKKLRHLQEGKILKNWTIFVGVSLFTILGLYVWQYFHESKAGVVPWREIIGFFVLSSVTFWAVKILVRLLLSAIHLAEDAAEREVMAMTYMALIRGDGSKTKFLEDSDRALVLGPLFRPSATGVIDDGAPPHVSEIITKVGR